MDRCYKMSDEKRQLKQVSVLLYEDQIEPLTILCKLKLFNGRNDYFRQNVDDFIKENKELLEGVKQ